MGLHFKLDQVSKRYNQQWIIRHLSFEFESNGHYAIFGANGSGKSTLLKMLSGYLTPSQGRIEVTDQQKLLSVQDLYHHISYAAPYLSLPTQINIKECLQFVRGFKSFIGDRSIEEVFELMELPVKSNSLLHELSSGQLQRVHLVIAVLTNSKVLLLDEPGSYLDMDSKKWMSELILKFCQDRTIIVASNDPMDFLIDSRQLDMSHYH